MFDRVGRRLVLTEVGRIVLAHAERIFDAGEELAATLSQSRIDAPPLRIGAMSVLSRNFQLTFLRPLLASGDVDLVLKSGDARDLFDALNALSLDVVLTTEPPPSAFGREYRSQRLAEHQVLVHGAPARLDYPNLTTLLAREPLIVPTQSAIRLGFEALVDRLGVAPRIAAEVDDMAMVRLLARADAGVAIAPSIVLADEIDAGLLQTAPFDLGVVEHFYAVTLKRQFPHPRLRDLSAFG